MWQSEYDDRNIRWKQEYWKMSKSSGSLTAKKEIKI